MCLSGVGFGIRLTADASPSLSGSIAPLLDHSFLGGIEAKYAGSYTSLGYTDSFSWSETEALEPAVKIEEPLPTERNAGAKTSTETDEPRQPSRSVLWGRARWPLK